jgi:hypothetical protein
MPDDVTIPIPSAPTAPPAPADWRTFITDDLKADPVVSSWAEKASEKDIPSIIKGYAHAQKRMGSAINLPGKDAKPEDVQALRARLYEAGVFTPPPQDPKEYGLANPGTLPDGLRWSDELAGKFATALHKHGVPKEAVGDLLPLYLEALQTTSSSLKVDQEKSMASLRAEYGEKFDERLEQVRRMTDGIFTDPEEVAFFEESGIADHPKFLSVMMRLAPLAMQDSSFIESIPHKGGELTPEQVRTEYAEIISNPQHPMHAGLMRRDPKVEQYVNDLYRKAYGNAKVQIGEGLGV